MTTLFISFICFCIIAAIAYKREKRIKQLKDDLLVADNSIEYYKRIVNGFHDRMKEEEEKYSIIQADYCTSDSDYTKYSSQKAMENAIRSKMAMLIGSDLVKKFEPRILPIGEGKQKYSLVLKVKKI